MKVCVCVCVSVCVCVCVCVCACLTARRSSTMLHCSIDDALVSRSFCSPGTRNVASPFLW